MATLDTIGNIWKNLRELDLRPLREAAEQNVVIAIVGAPGTGRHDLADQLRSDPAHPGALAQTSISVIDLAAAERASHADLIILLLRPDGPDPAAVRDLVNKGAWADRRVLVFYNELGQSPAAVLPGARFWAPARVVYGSTNDRAWLERELAGAVLDMLPDRHLALGRCYPLLRLPIARHLINDACWANATYAFGTGLAEIVPVLDLPLNLADMVVLTKNQALLVYKLGLALGLPREWQYYVTELGGVIGGGFLWRQAARSLVGLIPAWGIVPKTAIAYTGTYVVGQVVLQWYLTGRQVPRAQMQALYRQAFAQGKAAAKSLAARFPRPPSPKLRPPRLPGRRPAQRACAHCGARNDPDAAYCKKCGQALLPA